MKETILSAGIDIGTTTLQGVFSRLTLERTEGFGLVPSVNVTKREVVYRSPIYFTPLDDDGIDAEAAASLVQKEFCAAEIRPDMLGSGAVIITGETARKRNARAVCQSLAELAGDFVVAAAGPDLESLLAGRGAGADVLSGTSGKTVLNIDVGGGTSNFCLFRDGAEIDCGCMDIGGRVIRVDDTGRILKMSPKVYDLLNEIGVPLQIGEILTLPVARQIAATLAALLAQGANLAPLTPLGKRFITNHGLLPESRPDCICFSGGVGACMAKPQKDLFAYQDLGVLLAQAIRESPCFSGMLCLPAAETMRATVIGAGNCSLEVSGSTIACENVHFPLKGLAVAWVPCKNEAEVGLLAKNLDTALGRQETTMGGFALAMEGPACPSFSQLEKIADALAPILAAHTATIPIVLQHDFAKALGQALRRRLGKNFPIVCVDGIACRSGDYIDIGSPVGGGVAVPVLVRTLIFMAEE